MLHNSFQHLCLCFWLEARVSMRGCCLFGTSGVGLHLSTSAKASLEMRLTPAFSGNTERCGQHGLFLTLPAGLGPMFSAPECDARRCGACTQLPCARSVFHLVERGQQGSWLTPFQDLSNILSVLIIWYWKTLIEEEFLFILVVALLCHLSLTSFHLTGRV